MSSPADFRRRAEKIANLRELEKLHAHWLSVHTEQARQERSDLERVQAELVELGASTELPA